MTKSTPKQKNPTNASTMELLKQLYRIHSYSGQEKRMRKFIIRWVRKHIPEADIKTDFPGNIYVTKGKSDTYPCVVSHIDQVQKIHSDDFKAVETDDIIFGYSPSNKRQEGLGADDKNGIWCCLNCLKKYDVVKAAFFVQEELGCLGSGNASMEFFTDTRYVIQADRKGSGDLVTSIWGELCSHEFVEAIGHEDYGYRPTDGMTTDVGALKDNGLSVSAVNLSCGYYEPHTDHEFTVKKDLLNCLDFICHIIDTCPGTYPHESYGLDSGFEMWARELECDEMREIISDYLSYQPDTPAEMFFETYKEEYPHLQLKDYQEIINENNNLF